MSEPVDAYARAQRGRFDALGEPLSAGARLVLRAMRALADPERESAVPVAALRETAPPHRARLAVQLARASWLAGDAATLAAIGESSPDAGGPHVALIDAWGASLEGAAPPDLEAAEADAAALGDAMLTVDLAATRGLARLEEGDLAQGLHHARRAMRMARTEEIPQSQYLAGYALARARRHGGHPHLALRIVTALCRVAPAPWRPRLSWEALLSAGPELGEEDRGRLPDAARAFWTLVEGAPLHAAEDASSGAHAVDAVRPGFEPYRREVDAALALLGLGDGGDARVEPFLRGLTSEPPYGLRALGGPRCLAYLRCTPGAAPRRVFGLAIADSQGLSAGARPGRVETAIAALASQSPRPIGAFFHEVYGFAYDPELHRGALDVLLHRMREALAGRAGLERVDGALRIDFVAPTLVPDPRCERVVDERLLRVIAGAGACSAKAAAAAAGLPLRTAQTRLQTLVDEGACAPRRVGRRIEYVVEDTTFSEPTLVG